MDDKVADNSFRSVHSELNSLENEIDNTQQVIKNLDNIEECFNSLNKNINKCVELLGMSMKGKKVAATLDGISEDSKINYNKTMSIIDEDKERNKSLIKDLYIQKEELSKKIREENNKKEEKKEE